MEANFERKAISCLNTALRQVQNSEQTLEMKLPEGMPDVGQVLTAWGQPILRSKEWRDDQVQFTGGMMVWVLYAPENGGEEQCVQGWIPFQMRWDLPENAWCMSRESDIFAHGGRKGYSASHLRGGMS